MSRPSISVVIPAYNAERFISSALESVFRQTLIPSQVVVVDDGSSDETEKVARDFEGVHYHRIENSGVAAARNFGVTLTTGEFVAFLDSDDVWLPQKLESQIMEIESSPEAAFTYTGVHLIDEDGRFTGRIYPPSPKELVGRLALIECQGIAMGSTGLVRRACFDDVEGFDVRMSTAADWDLAFRLASRFGASWVDRPLVLYRRHAGQMHDDPIDSQRDAELFLSKLRESGGGGGLSQVRLNRARANLHISLAGRYRMAGESAAFRRHVLKAVFRHPGRVVAALKRLSSDPSSS